MRLRLIAVDYRYRARHRGWKRGQVLLSVSVPTAAKIADELKFRHPKCEVDIGAIEIIGNLT